jgi:hypothetical protein
LLVSPAAGGGKGVERADDPPADDDLQVLLGLGHVARHQIVLDEAGVRAAVLRIDLQGLVVVEEGLIGLACFGGLAGRSRPCADRASRTTIGGPRTR